MAKPSKWMELVGTTQMINDVEVKILNYESQKVTSCNGKSYYKRLLTVEFDGKTKQISVETFKKGVFVKNTRINWDEYLKVGEEVVVDDFDFKLLVTDVKKDEKGRRRIYLRHVKTGVEIDVSQQSFKARTFLRRLYKQLLTKTMLYGNNHDYEPQPKQPRKWNSFDELCDAMGVAC